MARGYVGPPDPEKGQPHRHTRAKIELLMKPIMNDPLALAAVIGRIAQKRPDDVLDAVIYVVNDEKEVAGRAAAEEK